MIIIEKIFVTRRDLVALLIFKQYICFNPSGPDSFEVLPSAYDIKDKNYLTEPAYTC
jgi:hypothetical protein